MVYEEKKLRASEKAILESNTAMKVSQDVDIAYPRGFLSVVEIINDDISAVN